MYGDILGRSESSVIRSGGNKALKIYSEGYPIESVRREAEIQQFARRNGIRTPEVYGVTVIEGRPMLVMERVTGLRMDEAMRAHPELTERMLEDFFRLQMWIRAVPYYPETRFTDLIRAQINRLPLDDGKRLGLLSAIRALPDAPNLCHCEFSPQNVMIDDGGLCVLDWSHAAAAHPLADACQTYLLLLLHEPQLAERYHEMAQLLPREGKHAMMDWLTPLAYARRALNRSDEPSLASLVDLPTDEQ